MAQTHSHLATHRIRKWCGAMWKPASLKELGVKLNLGHGGNPCLADLEGKNATDITVVDLNGVHEVSVRWCSCTLNPTYNGRMQQLLRQGFFPSSPDIPRTVFTFRAMRHFHLSQLQGRMSVWDWCNTIHRYSENVVKISVKASEFAEFYSLCSFR